VSNHEHGYSTKQFYFQGLGTDERAVIDLLCSKQSGEIEELKKAYLESK
jgi:hypothetical protein